MPDLACLRCGSTNFLPEGRVESSNSRISVDIPTKPASLIFTDIRSKELHARVCGSCGHAELFIEDARELWEKYQLNEAMRNPNERKR